MKLLIKLNTKLKNISSDQKSVLTLVGGTAIAQGLNFLFSPILTRLFSPEVFGDLSVFTSITGIIGIIICLRYELAIVLPKDDDEGFFLFKLSLLFALIVSAVTGLVFLIKGNAIYKCFGAEKLARYWHYVPITLLLTGVIQAANYWLTRTRQFKVLSINKFVPVIVLNLVSIGLGLAGNVEIGARLFAVVISNIANVLILTRVIFPEFKLNKHVKQYRVKKLIIRYKNFLLYDIWGSLVNNLSWMVIPILMNYFYGSFAAGQYAIGLRVIQLPANIIGASIGQVFLKVASERLYTKNLYSYTIYTVKKLLLYTAPFALILMIYGKYIFVIMFGNQWEVAGRYAQILSIWSLVWFIASPLSVIYMILQKQYISFILSCFNLLTRFLSLYFGGILKNDIIGLILFALSGLLINILSIYIALKLTKKNDI